MAPLQKGIISIPLTKGVDHGQSPHLVEGGLLKLENGRWERTGEIVKRHGQTAISGTYGASRFMASYKDRPVAFDDLLFGIANGATYDAVSFEQVNTLLQKPIGTFSMEMIESEQTVISCDVQEAGSVRVVAYSEIVPDYSPAIVIRSWVRSYSLATGRQLAEFSVGTDSRGVRLVWTGAKMRFFYTTGGGTLTRGSVNTTTGGITDEGAMANTFNIGVLPYVPFDACAILGADYAVMLVGLGTGGDLRIITLDNDNVERTVLVTAALCKNVGCCLMAAGVGIAFWCDETGVLNELHAIGYGSTLAAPLVSDATLWSHATSTIDRVGGAYAGTNTVRVYFTVLDANDERDTLRTTYTSVGGTGTPSGIHTRVAQNSRLVCKPMWHADLGNTYAVVCTSSAEKAQRCYAVVRDDGVVCARMRHGYANGFPDSIYDVNPPGMWTAGSAAGTWKFVVPSRVTADRDGVAMVSWTRIATRGCSTETRDHLIVGGAVPYVFDGRRVQELGFAQYPPQPAAAVGTSTGVSGDVSWCVIYEAYDGQGAWHRSFPSVPVALTGLVNVDVDVTVNTLTCTERSDVRIALYRTLDGGTEFYRVGEIANDETVPTVTITDTVSDVDLADNERLYTDGGIKGAMAVHPFEVVGSHQQRVVYAPLEWPSTRVHYSKAIEYGVAPEFRDDFVIDVPFEGGDITGLASFLDRLLIFKEMKIYAVDGEGPDATGYGRGYSTPYLISDIVGCSDQHTIVRTPHGVMFSSENGIWLLDTSMQLQPVGLDVKYETGLYDYTHAAVQADQGHVVFFSQDTNAPALVFDFIRGNWATWTNHLARASCVSFGGKLYHMRTDDQVVVQDNTTSLDQAANVILKVVPPWVKVAGVGGLQRVWRGLLNGHNISPHNLHIDTQYDFDPVVVDEQEFPGTATEERLVSPDQANDDLMGWCIATSGNWLVVGITEDWGGAGRAEVFRKVDGHYQYHSTLTAHDGVVGHDYFGYSVAIDGDTIVVGDEYHSTDPPNEYPRGKAYVFRYSTTTDTWAWEADIEPPAGPPTTSRFGHAVAVYDDCLAATDWSVTTNTGKVWIFNRTGTTWSYTTSFAGGDSGTNDYFGEAAAMSGDTLVIGAPRGGTTGGAAYVFVNDGGWSEQEKLQGLDVSLDDFGISVAIDGNRVVVGARYWYSATHYGKAFVFDRSGTSWSLISDLSASDEVAYNDFGWAVAVLDEVVVVGARYDNEAATDGGAVYVFTPGSSWSQKQKIVASDAVNPFWLGTSVAVTDEHVIAGAIKFEGDEGAVYVFSNISYCFDAPEHYGAGLPDEYQHKSMLIRFGVSRQKCATIRQVIYDAPVHTGVPLGKGFSLTNLSYEVARKPTGARMDGGRTAGIPTPLAGGGGE